MKKNEKKLLSDFLIIKKYIKNFTFKVVLKKRAPYKYL